MPQNMRLGWFTELTSSLGAGSGARYSAASQEHAAWDSSSVPRRLATWIRHFRRHLNEKDLSDRLRGTSFPCRGAEFSQDVQEDCILALHSLLKVPAVALISTSFEAWARSPVQTVVTGSFDAAPVWRCLEEGVA